MSLFKKFKFRPAGCYNFLILTELAIGVKEGTYKVDLICGITLISATEFLGYLSSKGLTLYLSFLKGCGLGRSLRS